MKKINFIYSAIILLTLFSLLLMVPPKTTSAALEPSYTIVHCNINISYIEDNLCESENCSPIVKLEYGGHGYHIDELIEIYGESYPQAV